MGYTWLAMHLMFSSASDSTVPVYFVMFIAEKYWYKTAKAVL